MRASDPEDAREMATKLRTRHPDARTSHYERVLPIRNTEARQTVIDSLRAAGIPE